MAGVVLALVAAGPARADKIVFASNRDGTYDIWTMNPDGTGQAKLAGSPSADDFSPVVSTDGTKIAFIRGFGATSGEPEGDLMVMNSDGTGEYKVTFGANDPSWSPSGTQLSFGSIGHASRDGEVWKVTVDGTGATPLAAPARDNLGTSWSPDGQKIAFHAQIGDALPQNEGIWSVKPDGTGLTQMTHADDSGDGNPDWSPSGAKIAFDHFGALRTMNSDGSGQTAIPGATGIEPAWSPNGSQLAFIGFAGGNNEVFRINADGSASMNLTNNAASDIDPDWLPEFAGYARPKGASPFRVSMVLAYKGCGTPNRWHGQPLVYQSCSPPQQASNYATVGTADANGKPALNEGSIKFETIVGNPSTPADEADVKVETFMDDLFTKDTLADYTGVVHTHLQVRFTDRLLSGAPPNTGTTDLEFHFDTPCSPVADPNEGSTCALTTTWDSIYPGLIREGGRAIWSIKRIEFQDGGADGVGTTTNDNTLLATPGVFVP